jgi:hypothetical protein
VATVQVLYWHDIPVQVKASEGRRRHSAPLSDRFQEAVDAAAMAAGLVGSDAYSDQFRWGEPQEQEGDPAALATAMAAALELQYDEIDWRSAANDLREQLGSNSAQV